jgi:hypothetical protein
VIQIEASSLICGERFEIMRLIFIERAYGNLGYQPAYLTEAALGAMKHVEVVPPGYPSSRIHWTRRCLLIMMEAIRLICGFDLLGSCFSGFF